VKESNLLLEERCCYTDIAHPASPLRRPGPVESRLGALLDKAFCPKKKRQVGGSAWFPGSKLASWNEEGFSAGPLFTGRAMAERGDGSLCSYLCQASVSQPLFALVGFFDEG